jgi:hypothetical protein
MMTIADTTATIELPFERPLYAPPLKPLIADVALEAGEEDLDASALFAQVIVDKAQLARHVRHSLQGRSQVTLRELCEARPLQQVSPSSSGTCSSPRTAFRPWSTRRSRTASSGTMPRRRTAA